MIGSIDDLYSQLDRYNYEEPHGPAKKYFVDACISLDLLCNIYGELLELNDRLALEQAYRDVSDALNRWDYARFFYKLTKILSDENKIEWNLREGQFDCLSMASLLRGHISKTTDVNSSLLDSFLERAPKYVDSCFYIWDNEKYDESLKALSIYGLLSALSAYISYIKSDFKFYFPPEKEDLNPKIRANAKSHITKWIDKLKPLIVNSSNEKAYVNYGKTILHEAYKIGLAPNDVEIDIQIRKDLDKDIWCAINILKTSKSIPNELIKSIMDKLDERVPWYIKPRVPLALCMISEEGDKFNFNLVPKVGSIDVNKVINYVFPSMQNIPSYDDLDTESEIVDSWNDEKLQHEICEIVKESPFLSDDEKREVTLESKKRDSGYEIADIVIPIKIDQKTVVVCIPLKTGKEVGGPRNKTLPTKMVVHQILRPLQHYKEKACVILISVRFSSQDLANTIQKAKTLWNWPIVRIEGNLLISLLKYHSKIPSPSS